jgi:hypothetical protein
VEKKHQVFISSTYADLVEERSIVTQSLLTLDCIPLGMEQFPAADQDAWSYIESAIDQCDYFILLIGGTYGSELRGKSYTQREYEYALKTKKSILSLIHKDVSKLSHDKVERAVLKLRKLERFKRLAERKLCDYWTNNDNLSTCVVNSILKLKRTSKQPGWIRATDQNIKHLSDVKNQQLLEKNRLLERKINLLSTKPIVRDGGTPISLRVELEEKIRQTDLQVNSCYPAKIHSPTTRENTSFSSERLINSLSSMDIPIPAIIDALELAVPEIVNLRSKIDQLSTSNIRKAISNALYKLNIERHGEPNILKWGDHYVRRYGNPDKRILVICEGGVMEPLNYPFIKKKIIPDMLEQIIGVDKVNNYLGSFRSIEVKHMAEQILAHIKNLNLLRINYSTIIALSKDLALQPPHPWLVSKSFDREIVNYDFERAVHHKGKVEEALAFGGMTSTLYSTKECLHHSCSGILARYGMYMGCGYMTPFYNFRFHVNRLNRNPNMDLSCCTELVKLVSHLSEIGTNVPQVWKLLSRIDKDIQETSMHRQNHDFTDQFSKDVLEVFRLFQKLYFLR